MSKNQKKESKWFNDVIAKTLDGKGETRIERLSEKQVAAFGRFMVSDRTDYNGQRRIYESENGRFTATITSRKYCDTFKVYDHWMRNVERALSSIDGLHDEIKKYREFDEEDMEDLCRYRSELVDYSWKCGLTA